VKIFLANSVRQMAQNIGKIQQFQSWWFELNGEFFAQRCAPSNFRLAQKV